MSSALAFSNSMQLQIFCNWYIHRLIRNCEREWSYSTRTHLSMIMATWSQSFWTMWWSRSEANIITDCSFRGKAPYPFRPAEHANRVPKQTIEWRKNCSRNELQQLYFFDLWILCGEKYSYSHNTYYTYQKKFLPILSSILFTVCEKMCYSFNIVQFYRHPYVHTITDRFLGVLSTIIDIDFVIIVV